MRHKFIKRFHKGQVVFKGEMGPLRHYLCTHESVFLFFRSFNIIHILSDTSLVLRKNQFCEGHVCKKTKEEHEVPLKEHVTGLSGESS